MGCGMRQGGRVDGGAHVCGGGAVLASREAWLSQGSSASCSCDRTGIGIGAGDVSMSHGSTVLTCRCSRLPSDMHASPLLAACKCAARRRSRFARPEVSQAAGSPAHPRGSRYLCTDTRPVAHLHVVRLHFVPGDLAPPGAPFGPGADLLQFCCTLYWFQLRHGTSPRGAALIWFVLPAP